MIFVKSMKNTVRSFCEKRNNDDFLKTRYGYFFKNHNIFIM